MKPLAWAILSLLTVAGARAQPLVIARKNVVYGEAAGQPLKLDYCLPPGNGPFAAVILVHGGGWFAGDKEGDVRPLQPPLTAAGIPWFSLNYRLAPQFRYPACLDDVLTGIRWVKAHAADFHIDPSRIALVGVSAGGHLVEMAALQGGPDTRVAAVVPFFGPSDLLAQTLARGGLRRDLRSLLGCTSLNDATRDTLRAASPVNYVHPGLPPFLLFHGTADRVVPYAQSVRFADKLRSAGVSCDLVTVPGGVHAMGNWNRVDPQFKAVLVDWLKKTLAPRPTQIASVR